MTNGAFVALDDLADRPWRAFYLVVPEGVGYDDVTHLAPHLPEDEHRRWEQRRSRKSRFEFLVGRLLVRAVLSSALRTSPGAVRLVVPSSGKPRLEGEPDEGAPLSFSLSHAGGHFVLALSVRGQVGADIQPVGDYREDLVRRFFRADEQETLSKLAPDGRAAGFFHMWTVKEACSKAVGGDLFASLGEIRSSLDETGFHAPVRWEALDVGAGAKAAVALCPHSNTTTPEAPGRLERVAFERLLGRYER